MAGRKVRDGAEARALLAGLPEGQTRSEWARAHGIDPRSLHAWFLNLGGRRRAAPSPLRLVELVPAAAAPAKYIVRVGAMAVEVDEHFDERTLIRLLRVLEAC